MTWMMAVCLLRGTDAAGETGVSVLLDDFENVGSGTKWVVVGVFGHQLQAEIGEVAGRGHDGNGCARLHVGAGSMLAIRREFGKGFVHNGDKETLILPGVASRLGLWVRGNRSATRVLANVSGATLDFGALDYDGWRFLEKDIPALKESPARLREIRFDASKAPVVENPEILMDDLMLVTVGTKDAPLFIEFERLALNRELSANDRFTARLRVQNLLPEKRSLGLAVDLTTSKTAVQSHAETLRHQELDVELAAGERKSWTFDYQMDAGIYNGYLRVTDPVSGGLLADQRIEYAVFPGADGAGGRDFRVWNSGLSPIVLMRNAGPRLLIFQGLESYGLGGPTRLACVIDKRTQVFPQGRDIDLSGMSEAWMLFWYSGAKGWDQVANPPYPIDVPILVIFERRPLKASPAGTGWELVWPGPCGHVAFVPLYGTSYVRAGETTSWTKGLPRKVVQRCRLLAEVSREYPISVEETFKVDPIRDEVLVRNRFEYLSLDDEWGTPHRRVAPLEYMTALVNRFGWKALRVNGKVIDLDLAVGQGLWAGIEGDETTYRLSGLLKYVHAVEQPKEIPADEPLLAEARKNFNAQQALWHRFHNSWWAMENLRSAGAAGPVFPYLDTNTRDYVRVAGRAVASFSLNPNNLVFEYDPARGVSYALDGQNYERMGWCDANATSNEALRCAYAYAVGTGDLDLIRRRWPFLCSFYNVPVRMSHWGDSAFNAGGGDTFGSNLNGTISFARMACWVGDDDSFKFASYHAAKQFLALYGICMVYPKWVIEKNLWAAFQETFVPREENGRIVLCGVHVREVAAPDAPKDAPREKVRARIPVTIEDIPFTDLRGANVGIVPWCMVQRTSDSQERFLKDHARPYSQYMIDGLPRKWLPRWYDTVYGKQEKVPKWGDPAPGGETPPSWFQGSVGPSITPNLSGWDSLFDTPLPERRAKLERFVRNNYGSVKGREFDIILAGLEQRYRMVWDGADLRPEPDRLFRKGLEKVAGVAPCPSMAVSTLKFRWPALVWQGLRSPVQPPLNSVGPLPLCGVVPDPARISFDAVGESPNWGLSTWSANYLGRPEIAVAGDLERLPVHLQSIVIEKDLPAVNEHVKNLIAQSSLEWNVAGPLPYFQASDFDRAFPPEEKIDLAADYGTQKIGRDYLARWQKARASMYFVDINKLFPPNCDGYVHQAQVYACLWVRSPEDRKVKIALGSDDGCKVWINGVLVWKNWVHRASGFDQDVFPAQLRKGWNAVLLKVFNRMYGCGFDFYFRVADDRLLPLGDLEFRSDPPSPGGG
jgi:hypothetical protein